MYHMDQTSATSHCSAAQPGIQELLQRLSLSVCCRSSCHAASSILQDALGLLKACSGSGAVAHCLRRTCQISEPEHPSMLVHACNILLPQHLIDVGRLHKRRHQAQRQVSPPLRAIWPYMRSPYGQDYCKSTSCAQQPPKDPVHSVQSHLRPCAHRRRAAA